ncbi:MAG: Gfo/Idh/MocA family oxidoreductase [Verrucomicrobia bacterium]|nr:Gfo/Idh/MocA family oxidoreductase [Verrucomicrobiota bacterium]MCH8511063.1 Gfo/Idh/MocA family oxidoreductase [Kiritimatiellia bacterium]
MKTRKIRMGMVGGGEGAFIGEVHRMAARLDGRIELVCGAFSSNAKRSKASGEALGLDPDRVYGSFEEMFKSEAALPEDERMQFVSIVTPNVTHFPVAKLALQNGFHVMSDKPATFSLAEARQLQKLVEKSGLQYGLTHNYTGYPLVKEARNMVRKGKLGEIRKVVVEYPQGWLATALEADGQKQADWRTDPARAGISCCMGDIGTHAENLAEYITGLKITELCADLTTFVPGRLLEDDGNVLLRFENGARGVLHASQISVGEENGLNIRVYGTKGGLKWVQAEPNTLTLLWLDKPMQILKPGLNHGHLSKTAQHNTRLPAGHPEAFLEAFANLYRNYADALAARLEGKKPKKQDLDFPTIEDGVRGMAFVETVVKSSNSKQKWVKMPG